jgi:hypothetical protein
VTSRHSISLLAEAFADLDSAVSLSYAIHKSNKALLSSESQGVSWIASLDNIGLLYSGEFQRDYLASLASIILNFVSHARTQGGPSYPIRVDVGAQIAHLDAIWSGS